MELSCEEFAERLAARTEATCDELDRTRVG